jgi:hypothetical protein
MVPPDDAGSKMNVAEAEAALKARLVATRDADIKARVADLKTTDPKILEPLSRLTAGPARAVWPARRKMLN